MKNLFAKTLVPLALFCALSFFPVHAASLGAGRAGKSYKEEGFKWQDVYIKGGAFKLTASIPGSPRNIFSNGELKVESTYKKTYYWLATNGADKQKPPKSYAAFVKKMKTKDGTFTKVKSKKKKFRYALNYTYSDEGQTGITRIYVTKNKIYLLGVLGNDLSHAEDFFNSFKLKKDSK